MWINEKGQEIEFERLVDPSCTALVVIDVQNDFCHADGAYGRSGANNDTMSSMADHVARITRAARSRGVLTIFVRATYDKEVTSAALAHNRHRLGLHQSLCLEGTWGADWYGAVAPTGSPNEVTLTKHRFDAFQGTALDLHLRSNGIKTVVITGVATSGCVESTVRTAFFLDYFVVVPQDCVAEPSLSSHRASLDVMGRCFARIASLDEMEEVWRPAEPQIASAAGATALAAGPRNRPNRPALLLVDIPDGDPVSIDLLDAARKWTIPVLHARSAVLGQGAQESPPADLNRASWMDGALRVDRQRMSAFADTRLGLLLRTNNISSVTVVARGTSLAATVLDALDMDYEVTLPRPDDRPLETSQDASIELLRAAGAQLLSVREIKTAWQGATNRSAQAA